MVRHIVLFKLNPSLSLETRQQAALSFKAAIEALPAVIPQIQDIQVGLNINPQEEWDIALVGDFLSLEDVATYSAHPSHLKAASLLKDVRQSRSCVDYVL